MYRVMCRVCLYCGGCELCETIEIIQAMGMITKLKSHGLEDNGLFMLLSTLRFISLQGMI